MLDFILGFLIGCLLMYWYVKHNIIIQELENVRMEFKNIHSRLITVIAEWQKKV
jgi:hypothetical protein